MQCFPFAREQGNGPANKMGMETGLNIYLVNLSTLIFLSNKDINNEMVPIEEPAVPEGVQDLKD
jgi:hypothetical protein